MLGFVFGGNHLLRVGEEGTSNEPKQAQIAKDNLPVSRKLPDETCANDCWNSEDDADSCFSFRFHILTPWTITWFHSLDAQLIAENRRHVKSKGIAESKVSVFRFQILCFFFLTPET